MTMIDTTATLAELVDAHPALARTLEEHRLDYCCGGHRSLAEACSVAHLDLTIVLADLTEHLESSAPAGDWTGMTVTELVDHLEATHHAYLWAELPRLSGLMEKVQHAHGARHPELSDVATCVAAIRADLEPHLVKEERVLFPLIRALDAGRPAPMPARHPIGVMIAEHDAVGDLLARVRTLTDDHRVPSDACASYQALLSGLAELEADTHLHIHKENNVLFPMAVELDAA